MPKECNTLCLHFSFLISNVARSGYVVECLKIWKYIFLHHILIIGNKGLFSVSNVKHNRHTENRPFPRIFFLSDNSGVFAITTVKCKETLQMHSFSISFVISGSIFVFTVTNDKCNKHFKYNNFDLFFIIKEYGF